MKTASIHIEDVYPMSDIQKGMVFLTLKNPHAAVYHDQFVYYVPRIDDQERFTKALRLMMDIHPILRTGFDLENYSQQVQIVYKDIAPSCAFEDIRSLDEEEQEAYIRDFMLEDRYKPYDFKQAPLWRINLFDLDDINSLYLIQFHHAILDGWSMASFNTQLFNIYAALQSDSDYRPAPLQASVKDAIVEEIAERNNVKTIEFWKEKLEDYNKLNIFTSVPVFDEYRKHLSREMTRQLKEQVVKDGVSYKNVIYGAFTYVLKVLAREDDFVCGIVSNTRPVIKDGDKVLGCFLNTLPMRLAFGNYKDLTWLEYFRAIEADMTVLKTKDRSTLYEISRISGKKMGAENPFFDILFNYIDFYNIYKELSLSSTEAKHLKKQKNIKLRSYEATNTYLDINLIDGTDDSIELHYKSTRVLTPGITLEKIQGYLEEVLSVYLSTPDAKINMTKFLSADDQDQINNFNATDTAYADKVVLDLFEEQVSTAPERIAVSDGNAQLSYGMLNEMTGQLADYLHQQYTIGAEELVGIRLDRSTDMLVAILGILKAGAAYVPVDMHYPEERISYIQADSRYKVCIDAAFMERFVQVRANYDSQYRIDGTYAYAIYTSGSTGEPKGVLNSHAGLYNRLLWMRDELGITADDIILQKTPYTFDVSVWELLLPGITGSELVFAKPEGHKDPAYLQELIYNKQITVLHFVPSMLGIFLEQLEPGKCDSLQHVVCSGEALPASMVADFKRRLPGVRLYNLYGPTEAAIDVTFVELTNAVNVTIGKPVANTRIYIVDEQLQQQPIGVPGELLIEGVQVAAGYLNKPALSAERFIPSPFRAGERIYRTGDLAKWLPDGEIAYLGRIDHQVKIRGNRIELGEIETKLEESPYVEQGVVVVKGEGAHRYLAAYVIPAEGYDQDELYAYLSARLPEYMVPGVITTMESFPLTVSGKLDRKALPEPVLNSSDSYVAPRTDNEQRLAEIWMKVLGITQVGIHDNFFRIGGDSILSIRLISRVNKVFNVTLTIGQLYEAGTIAQLSVLLEDQLLAHASRSRIKEEITARVDSLRERILPQIPGAADVYPMSDIQKGMVILSTLNPQAGVYHDQFVFHMPASDPVLFREAFSRLVSRHATLRTHFDLTTYGEEVQIVDESISFDIEYHDLRNHESSAQEQHIREFMVSERQRPFNTSTNMWRADVFRLSQEMDMLVLQFHHAILDGWSVASLNTELIQTYQQIEQQLALPIEPLKSTYRDAVIEELYEKHNADTIGFWKQELSDYKRLNIFRNIGTVKGYTKQYDTEFIYKLKKKCRTEGISLKTVFYGALTYVLKVLSCEEDFVLGMVTNNRPVIEDGDKILGCFLNTIPVRNRLQNSHHLSWIEYFKNIEQQLSDLRSKERLTLYEIARVTNEKSSVGAPFFDILFNYADFHIYNNLGTVSGAAGKSFSEKRLNVTSYEATNTDFDIDVIVSRDTVRLTYSLRNMLRPDISLEQFQEYMDQVLSAFLQHPDQATGNTELISTTEKEKILSLFSVSETPYKVAATIPELLRKQVARHAQKAALVDREKEISYAELEEYSNQFADYLQQHHHIQKGDFVVVEMERCAWMIIAMLGVMKAGAVHVPVNPQYPDAHKGFIYNDCNASLVINDNFVGAFVAVKETYGKSFTSEVTGEDLAYVIYTSGSTGQPKGVLIRHASLADYAFTFRAYFQLTAEDSIVQQASIAFDTSMEEIFPMLISGGAVVIYNGQNDIDQLFQLCEDYRISILSTNPFVLQHLNSVYDKYSFAFRALISGGDVLKPTYISNLWEKVAIYNTYGPTETTVCATYHKVAAIDHILPIGKPIANRSVYLLYPETVQLTPVGAIGEICISGAGVSAGYLNRPALTAEKFVADPFHAGQQMFRTGDLGRWLPDGSIEFFGRKDDQVKIRGYRIEPGEVEAVLLRAEGIKDATVLAKGANDESRQLVAYIVPGEAYVKEALLAHMKKLLPEYMVPALFVEMEALPQTLNGKTDKKALPWPIDVQTQAVEFELPEGPEEQQLAAIWKEVLHLEVIGVRNNFFELGGTSITVLKLRQRIEQEMGIAVNIVDLFTHNTIRDFAAFIRPGGLEEIADNTMSEVLKF
ncbi:non-ribosomal peptide synthetase [Chitinophaga rhizophila]|uniref:Amino acid adenylation domain-containing protein n=1 Tax=Chitinophaga rhizophila TaxID=2866212 RepID=A0ABS7GHK1_9BACT|nr:non-ribosomal peptide synthetase [Chitinophaga rhizophila]MBW8687176.1 amino acid adenylation domain-containing protein [Chitinophaga rhizophila]